jgi:PAS domain S-box-containing protein
MIVVREAGDMVRVIRPTGALDPEPLDPVVPRIEGDPVALALDRQEGTFWHDMTDLDGDAVWVALRHVSEIDWGLVILLDEETGQAPAVAFRKDLTDIAMALGAFAMVVGTILGLRFAAPIHDLAVVADRIRGGNLSARAVVRGEDEVGVLANAFNQMAEEMEERVTLLAEYQRFFEVSLDMLCIAGPDGFFKRVNPAFTHILGWTEAELLSRSFLEFVHPDDLEATQDIIDELSQGIPTVSFENRYRCANGNWRIISWRAQPDPDTGLFYAMARDVTENRERRLRAKQDIKDLRDRLMEAEARLRGGD